MYKSILEICFGLSLFVLLCGCSDGISGRDSTDKIMRGDTISLALGQTAHRESDDLTIRFEAVPRESRCPVDAECCWEGMASTRLAVWKTHVGASHATPSISGGGYDPIFDSEYDDSTLGYRVSLLSLTPHPRVSDPDGQDRYVAKLRFTSR